MIYNQYILFEFQRSEIVTEQNTAGASYRRCYIEFTQRDEKRSIHDKHKMLSKANIVGYAPEPKVTGFSDPSKP